MWTATGFGFDHPPDIIVKGVEVGAVGRLMGDWPKVGNISLEVGLSSL